MTGGRDSESEEPNRDNQVARLLMVAVLVLAVASTAVLVLSSSAAWLRLGVLAALWAALLGVFLASRFRKSMAERENEMSDLQSVYELELEREVAARREYELEVEASARKKVEESNRHDLAELRAELRQLRESLERLTGGEVLVERFALQARSTRMRALGADPQSRVVASGEDSARVRRSIMAGQPVDVTSTELMQRPESVAAQANPPSTPVRREAQRRPAYRPEPSRPQTPRENADEPRKETPAPANAQQPTRVSRPVRPEQRPQPVQVRRAVRAPEPPQSQHQQWPGQQPAAAPAPPAAQRPVQVTQRRPQPVRRETPQPAPQPAPAPQPSVDRRLEPTQRAEPVSTSRHRVEDQAAEKTGGHRRAAEDAPSQDWQSYREWRQDPDSTTQQPAATDEPKWADDPETTGAHAAGTSVAELLAQHGKDDAPRSHRRRAE